MKYNIMVLILAFFLVVTQSACEDSTVLDTAENETTDCGEESGIEESIYHSPDNLRIPDEELFEFIEGKWRIIEFYGTTRDSRDIPIEDILASEALAEQRSEVYINKEFEIDSNDNLVLNRMFEHGYYVELSDFRVLLRSPMNVSTSDPIVAVGVSNIEEFDDEEIGMIIGSDGKSFIKIDHSYFLLERI